MANYGRRVIEPRVLFVSKPIAPPWNDGSKNLVRDVARTLSRARATVLTTVGAPSLGEHVAMEPIYATSGRFAPGLAQNARVVRRLLLGDPLDVWHFVFAPNPASSTVARFTSRARRTLGWKGRVVQTIASAPRSFDGVAQWIFGDVVVVVSEWMRGRLLGAGVKADVRVVPPCAQAPRVPTEAAKRATREKLGVGDAPIVLYPGDYEVSHGAATVARAVAAIVESAPDVRVVFACRAKTAKSGEARAAIERDLRAAGLLDRTRHAGDEDDMPALLAASRVVAFPVDDLYAKVDIPLVLLEALALGIPVVAARGGPREALTSAACVEPEDDAALATEVVRFLREPRAAQDAAARGSSLFRAKFTPEVVAAAYDDLYAEALAALSRLPLPRPESARLVLDRTPPPMTESKTSSEVRAAFLDFFGKKGHAICASAPLIPQNDPTLMFANAGMVPFKDVFTGKDTRPFTRATSSQKCIRISGKHNDLENVGVTARHHTFFEMLGNFSFGDYFKEDAIAFAWELLTKVYELPANKLCITVFGGENGIAADEEARAIWRKVAGYGDDKIIGLGMKDNFWQMGETGPCGPCTEIHFWNGPGDGDMSKFLEEPTPDGKGWTEIWNNVFMQFERSIEGGEPRLEKLPKPCVDTGMGLERVSSVLQGKTSNYETDLLRTLVDEAGNLAGKRYFGSQGDDDVSMRVIADHARTTAFLIAEGVFPDRGGRPYVLRRVMRRAIRHGHRLGI